MAFNKAQYDQQYNKEHVKRLFVPFNDMVPEDAEMREWLEQVGNKTQYIKQLIRDDMTRQENGGEI